MSSHWKIALGGVEMREAEQLNVKVLLEDFYSWTDTKFSHSNYTDAHEGRIRAKIILHMSESIMTGNTEKQIQSEALTTAVLRLQYVYNNDVDEY